MLGRKPQNLINATQRIILMMKFNKAAHARWQIAQSREMNTNFPLRNRFSAFRIEENDISDENDHHASQNEDNATRNRQDKIQNQRKKNVKKGDTGKKITTLIVGDSMVKHLDPKRLKRSMAAGNHNIYVETYRGSNTEAMSHHIRPCVAKKPDQIMLHVGTSDIRGKQTM